MSSTNELYSGMASFGRTTAYISAIIVTILSVIMIVFGVITLNNKNQYVKTTGTVTNLNCSPNENNIEYCETDYEYMTSSDKLSASSTSKGKSKYHKGEKINVWYEKENQAIAYLEKPDPKLTGWLIIGLAILLVLMSWGWVWMTRHYKFAAAMQGTSSALNILTERF